MAKVKFYRLGRSDFETKASGGTLEAGALYFVGSSDGENIFRGISASTYEEYTGDALKEVFISSGKLVTGTKYGVESTGIDLVSGAKMQSTPALSATSSALASGDTLLSALTKLQNRIYNVEQSTASVFDFKGTIGTGGTVTALPTSGVVSGDSYRVITAGTYAGETCEVGDIIIAVTDDPTWTIVQTNIDTANLLTKDMVGTNSDIVLSGGKLTLKTFPDPHENASQSTLSSSNSVTVITSVAFDGYGRMDEINLETISLGNAPTATKLAAARAIAIGSASKNFDGSAAISFSLAEIGALSASGNAASATKLNTARTINGVAFDGQLNISNYCTCSTAAATAAKVAALATTSNSLTLNAGATVYVKFTYANTVASPTLNVSSTGAKAIYAGGSAVTANTGWRAGDVVTLIYDGTNWNIQKEVDASTSVAGIVQLSSSTSSTSTSLAATASAVKAAYDRGSTGITNAATAQAAANSAASAAATAQSSANDAQSDATDALGYLTWIES